MRIITGILLLVFLTSVSDGMGQEPVEEGDLTVIVKGFENEDGLAMIAVSNTEDDYDAKDEPFRGNAIKISEKTAIWTIDKIPFGEYAIKVFHDEYEDGELDTNFLGMPTEDYGFSNDARGSFGPASWEDAKFLFNSEKDTVIISIE